MQKVSQSEFIASFMLMYKALNGDFVLDNALQL